MTTTQSALPHHHNARSLLSVEGWINIDGLDLSGELLFQSLERQQVVAKDEFIVEHIVVGNAVWRMKGLLRILQKNAWL